MKLNSLLAISAIATLSLSGCFTDDDGTYNNTLNGSLIGGTTGAAVGAGVSNYLNDKDCDKYPSSDDLTDEQREEGVQTEEDCLANSNTIGAIAGAGIGAIAGGGFGAQLDQQEEELSNSLGGSGATITNTGDKLVVTLPEAITFPFDSDVVKSSLYGPLQTLAQSANRYPNEIVQVVGHTDSKGSDSYNQGLSERRANAVAQILRQYGLSSTRIQVVGMGERAPIASNDTEAGRQQNRRVEINLIPQE